MKPFAISVCLLLMAAAFAPVAHADMRTGNYALEIDGRYDFHTWIWAIASCDAECVSVNAIPQPVAKAFEYSGPAYLVDGHYTLAVDVPDGLRCGNVYYGPIIPTHDVYTWDAINLTGSLESSFATGCNNTPAGTITYAFTLARM